MTREIQSQLLGEFYAEKKNVMKLKGEDYANEDVLSNFKTAGANIGISAEQQCLSLIATKVARLGNLFAGKTPNNESVSDSILDLSNYTDLLYCLVNEENANVTNEEPQTKRWENVSPHPMLDVITNMNKTIQAGAEWHKKRRENSNAIEKNVKPKQKSILKEMMAQDEKDGLYEPISETYEPKVGDGFKDAFERIWEISSVKKLYYSLMNDTDGDINIMNLLHNEFHEAIASGNLTKIN